MNFDSYIISDTKTAITVLSKCPPPYSHKGFSKLDFKKKAFTLAEVLITLTIIGVVAAMTIPTLMSKYQKHTYVVGLKKAYSQLQNAWKMVPLTEGCPAGDYDCAGWKPNYETPHNIKLLSKQFKISKLCLPDSDDALCSDSMKASGAFITNDGMIYMSSHGVANLRVDINGNKGPNLKGRDIFAFELCIGAGDDRYWLPYCATPTVIPYGAPDFSKNNDTCTPYNEKNVNSSVENGLSCTAKVLFENSMNY